MKRHVIQFDIDVPDKSTLKELIEEIKALMDLLHHPTSNLQIDPPPEIQQVPAYPPVPYPTPYKKPLPPYKPWIDGPPWKKTDYPQWESAYKASDICKKEIDKIKSQLEDYKNLGSITSEPTSL